MSMPEHKLSIDDLLRVKQMVSMAGLIRGFDHNLGWVDLRIVMGSVIDQAIAMMRENEQRASAELDD